MIYFWLLLVVVLGVIEVVTFNLVSIWFVLSGIVALGVSLFIDNFLIQFGVFVILGIIFMVLIRKYLEPKIMGQKIKTNLDRIIGMKGVVTEDIDDVDGGEVKVDGKRWSAFANFTKGKGVISKGEYVKILGIKGVKLEVELWKE